jgi:hypothetical protein
VPNLRDQLIGLGWRQGSIIEAGAIDDPALAACPDAEAFLVLNQTCDLINESLKKEPVVELLPLKRVGKADRNFENGHNPRQIHFELQVGGVPRHVEAFAPGILTIPREKITVTPPSTAWGIPGGTLKSLLVWRAARYLRTAFPDAFEARLKLVANDFKALIRGIHQHVVSLHLALEPFAEAAAADPYEIDILLVVSRTAMDDDATRKLLNEKVAELQRLVNSADGLVCNSCKARAPHEVSLEEADRYLVWERYDYLSFGEDD